MLKIANTAIATVGNGVLTAAALKGQVITRSGPTGAFTDTFDSAANIAAALAGLAAVTTDPVAWLVEYINTTAYVATLAADAGATVSVVANTGANLNIPANSVAIIEMSVALPANVMTATVLYRNATS